MNETDTELSHFSISMEMIQLMQWLMQHDPDGLKRLVVRALNSGLAQKIATQKQHTAIDAQESQQQIVDFFMTLEALLNEAMDDYSSHDFWQRTLIPAVNAIDQTECDAATVKSSLDQATAQLHTAPHASPRELLLKELIKRWKPTKKNVVH